MPDGESGDGLCKNVAYGIVMTDVYSSMLIFILILDKMLKSIRGGCWNMKAPENVLQTGTAEIKPLEEH